MAEYISKQAFKEKYLCCGWLPEMSEEEFNSFPAAGVVPVVRCRECAHYKICDEWENGKRMLCEIHHHSYLDHDGDNHFCSWG